MHQHYEDILDRIDEPPTWFDEQGVPRYGAFSPNRLSNIYAREAALAEITCQGCGRPFNVAMDSRYAGKGRGLCDEIRLGRLHYGDPPNVRCCAAGPTMNSVMRCVLEYWSRDSELRTEWQRDPAYEGPVTETYEPADTVSEVLAAINAGHTTLRVDCTSSPNRYDLAGRVTAAIAGNGRILVACPMQIIAVASGMLKGLVPGEAIGNVQQPASITLVPLERLSKVLPSTFDTIVVLTGVPPWDTYMQRVKDEQERLWGQTKSWMEAAATGRVLIEFRLAGRRRVIESPGVVIDGWQMRSTAT
jgi:hypothetical protein